MINLSEKLIKIGLSLISPFPLFISTKIFFYVFFRVNILENYSRELIIFILIVITIIDFFILITLTCKEIRSHSNRLYFFLCIVLYLILDIIIAAPSVIRINPHDDFFIFDIMASLCNIIIIIVVSASHSSKATNM